MADNTIDTLNIQIESSSSRAVQSINDLIKKLDVLNKSLNGINTGGLILLRAFSFAMVRSKPDVLTFPRELKATVTRPSSLA